MGSWDEENNGMNDAISIEYVLLISKAKRQQPPSKSRRKRMVNQGCNVPFVSALNANDGYYYGRV